MAQVRERMQGDGAGRKGRPSLARVEDIDKRVLAAAGKCFIENGYAATSMKLIASAAGVTKPTLYQRYVDKEALLRAVVHARVELWSIAARGRAVDRGETLDARLRYYGRSML